MLPPRTRFMFNSANQSLLQASENTKIPSFRRDITLPKISMKFIRGHSESPRLTKIRVPLGDCCSYSNHQILC